MIIRSIKIVSVEGNLLEVRDFVNEDVRVSWLTGNDFYESAGIWRHFTDGRAAGLFDKEIDASGNSVPLDMGLYSSCTNPLKRTANVWKELLGF